jgi:hypothetical protein
MRSPVSRTALGECNAILISDFGRSEFDFYGELQIEFGASQKPVSRPQIVLRRSP